MEGKWETLQPEKRMRIFNAVISEFTEKGYAGASTNIIVQNAGISKGLLFHYFGNKKKLFLWAYDETVRLVSESFYQKFNFVNRDFFNRMQAVMKLKMELYYEYPDLFNFAQAAYLEDAPEVRGEVCKKNDAVMAQSYGKLFIDVDVSKMREGIELRKVYMTVISTLEKVGDLLVREAKNRGEPLDYPKAMEQIDEYIRFFRECFITSR